MQGKEFFRLVWPAAGYYCIAVPTTNQHGKRTYKHAIHDTMVDAYLDGRSRFKDADIYFGIFTHKQDRVMSPKWGKPLPSRKRENMAQAKCLFLDLDVGKGAGSYDNQGDALAALTRFIFRTDLPVPIVVSSGNGLHVYWPLNDPVDADDWKPHAANLRAMLDTHKVMYDPSRTTDTTSVLRMPTTRNHKDPADVKDVVVLFDGDGATDNATLFAALAAQGGSMTPVKTPTQVIGAGGNIVPGTNFPPTDPDEVADECAQVRALRDKNGNIPEPLWYAVIGVLIFCLGGREAIHKWSSGYPTYSYTETEEKIEQWLANGSVASCAKLNNDGIQGACQGCKHWGGQFKNPIVIVNKKPAPVQFVVSPPAAVVVNTCPAPVCDPPKPYQRTQGLSITRWDDVKSISLNVLFEMDLYPISVSSGIVAGQKINGGLSTWVAREWTNTKHLHWRTFEVPNGLLSDTRALAEHMVGHGWFAPITNDVAKYMSAYLRELKAHVGLRPQQTHLGWPDLNETDKFVLNGKIVTATGKVEPCVMAKTTEIATDGMTQAGTLLGQIASLNFYNHAGYEAHQFLIGAALAAPLFIATDQHGVVINLSGDSGSSKTTALKAAAAIWGNPAKFIINGTKNGSTVLSREARSAALLNLPTMVDEITHMEPDDARAMVMSATQARMRDALKSDRTPREPKLPGHRSAPMLTTANSSLHQIVNSGNNQAGTANSARVVEPPCPRPTVHSKSEADVAAHLFATNYGWMGEHFLTLAMPTIDHLFASVERVSKRIDGDVAARPMERFLVAAAAPTFVALTFAVYHGLLDWDVTHLYDWYVNTLFPAARSQLRDQGDAVASDNIMREFISAHAQDTVVATQVGPGSINVNPFHMRTQIAINHRVTAGEMWVSKQVFSDWCKAKKSNISSVLQDLHTLGVVKVMDTRKVLSSDTIYPPTLNRVFIVDATHPLIV